MRDGLYPGMTQTEIRRYSISIEIDFEGNSFSGVVSADCVFRAPSDRLELHSMDLEILECTTEAYIPLNHRSDDERNLLVIDLPVNKTSQRITITYRGVLGKEMAGLYRSRLGAGSCAVTQFEERDARRAFPCIDHPGRKSVFDISLIAPGGCSAIANTPAARIDSLDEGRKRYVFETTPPMATYLLFFGVGAFGYIEDTEGRVPIRVAGLEEKVESARGAIRYARDALDFLDSYTGVAYPLPKLDLIAVPDFAYGAMENFGAITYRENYLYLDPEAATLADIQGMANITAHEVAHMWFGDYVTPTDWSYVWLNEAFATYFGVLITDVNHPEWRYLELFVDGKESAMDRDSLYNTVPIEFEEGDFSEIDPSTAPIVYTKAGAILHMMRLNTGDGSFALGVREFLNRFAFGNANTDGFLEAFSSGAGAAASQMLEKWIRTPGLPMVYAERSGDTLLLEQSRFCYRSGDEISGSKETNAALWQIPVTLVAIDESGRRSEISSLLDGKSDSVALPSGTAAYKLNHDQRGYYRSSYARPDLAELISRAQELGNLDRAGLSRDLGAQHLAGMIPTPTLLDYLRNLTADEMSELPIRAALGVLGRCVDLLPGYADDATEIMVPLLSRVVDKIGVEPRPGERPGVARIRLDALWRLLRSGDEEIRTYLVDLFGRLDRFGRAESIEPDLVPLVLKTGAFEQLVDEGWFIRVIEEDSTSETLTKHVLGAIGWYPESRLDSILDYISTKVPARNRHVAVRSLVTNPGSQACLLPWIKRSVNEIRSLHMYAFASVVCSSLPTAGIGQVDETTEVSREAFGNRGIDGPLTMAIEQMIVLDAFVQRNAGPTSIGSAP